MRVLKGITHTSKIKFIEHNNIYCMCEESNAYTLLILHSLLGDGVFFPKQTTKHRIFSPLLHENGSNRSPVVGKNIDILNSK